MTLHDAASARVIARRTHAARRRGTRVQGRRWRCDHILLTHLRRLRQGRAGRPGDDAGKAIDWQARADAGVYAGVSDAKY